MSLQTSLDKKENLEFLGILVCQPQQVLDHKRRDGKRANGRYCYWTFAKYPRRIDLLVDAKQELRIGKGTVSESAKAASDYDFVYDEDDFLFTKFGFYVRLYFAVGGVVRGYFKCYASDENHSLRFHSEDWVSIENGEKIKPSQGFRYFNGGS